MGWPLQWTGSCKGRVPAVDGFLQWTGFCSGQAPAADWSLWRPVKVELIIHPRRFGKTLNMTMLRDFLILWRKAVLLIDEIQLAGYNQPDMSSYEYGYYEWPRPFFSNF